MTEKPRKLYRKPIINRVVLVPDENILAGCRSYTGSLEWGNDDCLSLTSGCQYGPTL